MSLFSGKPKQYALGEAKQIDSDFRIETLQHQVNDLQQKLIALEKYLGVYRMHHPSQYEYKKAGVMPVGLTGVTSGVASQGPDSSLNSSH